MLTILIALLALLIGFAGLMLASQASAGAAVVGFGCIVAVCARLAQASAHQSEARDWAKRVPTESPTIDRPPLPLPTTADIQQRNIGLGG